MEILNRVCRLSKRPHGMATPDGFAFSDEPLIDLKSGEFRVKTSHISLDPAMRGWIAPGKSYIEPVEIGDVMRAFGVGEVTESQHDDFKKGDWVVGLFGVQNYATSKGDNVYSVDINKAPAEKWIGGLGMPGLTAYFGLFDVAHNINAGETIVVSAASGAVGSIVGQLAKMKGARVVGIAGGEKKCRHVVDNLGFDACVDHKSANFADALIAATPDGIDVDFESIGGEIFDTILTRMNTFGRIALCGVISQMNATSAVAGLNNLRFVLVRRLKMQGFIIFDYQQRYPEALECLSQWYQDDKIKLFDDVREGGVDVFPQTLTDLYTGENFGKLILAL